MNRYKNKQGKNVNRYCGKDRPGKVRSPKGPLGSRWAYPPGIAESGVGLLETLAGLAVFALLAMIAAQAFRGASASRKETAQALQSKAPATASGREAGPSRPSAGGGAPEGRTISENGSDRIQSDRNGMAVDFRGGQG